MARTLEARLATIRAAIGWRRTILTDRRGDELVVPTLLLIDAWTALVLREERLSLPPRVVRFLADARLRPADGEMLLALQDACRARRDQEVTR
jgi:hypothetical protein